MLGPVLARGHADHREHRPPLGEEALDGAEARAVVGRRDGGQRVSETGLEIADGDADAPGAEVESQDRPGPGERREARGERSSQGPCVEAHRRQGLTPLSFLLTPL
jgi:hypothetical protein